MKDSVLLWILKIVCPLLSTLVLTWAVRRALLQSLPRQGEDGRYVLRYPWLIKIIPFVGLFVFAYCLVTNPILNSRALGDQEFRVARSYLCWSLALLVFMSVFAVEMFSRVINVTVHGLAVFSPWTGWKSLGWSEVRRIRFASFSDRFRIHGEAGVVLSVPRFMTGIQQFSADVLRNIPPMFRLEAEQKLGQLALGNIEFGPFSD